MKGLRTEENEKFLRFFAIVQEEAGKNKSVFFLDSGDGREFETEVLEGEDLMGWLIPGEKASAFEKEWENNDVSDDWSKFFCWAVWENVNNPTIKFN